MRETKKREEWQRWCRRVGGSPFANRSCHSCVRAGTCTSEYLAANPCTSTERDASRAREEAHNQASDI
jgi:hypothetical protein